MVTLENLPLGSCTTFVLSVLSFHMATLGTYLYAAPPSDRVLQLIIAVGPLGLVFLLRMILGRSKEMLLAVWLSVGWFAIRASQTPSMAFLRDYTQPIERLILG